MSILNTYIGSGPEDFDFDNILPENYIKYLDGIMGNTNMIVSTKPNTPPYYDNVYVVNFLHGVKPTKVVMRLQGDMGSDKYQFLYYNPNVFMFNMIPLGIYQKEKLVKNLFEEYFKDNIIIRFENMGYELILNTIRVMDGKDINTY